MPRIPSVLHSLLFRACLMLAAFAPVASAQFVFVGPASDPACNYHTIQEAVDAWAASTSTDFVDVVIANSQTYTATAITIPTPVASTGMTLRGDLPTCHLGAVSGHLVLDGTGNGNLPVIDINATEAGDTRRPKINLSYLDITGGQHAGGNGGGVRVRGNAMVTVFETNIHGNSAANGGGIAVEATAVGVPHLIMVGNQVPAAIQENHAAQDGGGLYCTNASVYCDRYCLIAGNTAGGKGGGIAQQTCETSIYPPNNTVPRDPNVGLRLNAAVGDGGGAWISGGYFSVGTNSPQKPAPIVGNVAGGSGGGLFYTSMDSNGDSHRGVQFDDNEAGVDGGALYADSGFLQLSEGGATGCGGNVGGCPRFRNNHAVHAGGAIALTGSAGALLQEVTFADNSAARASVLQLGGPGFGFTLTNGHFAGNHGASELLLSAGGYIDLRYVTIADNGGDDDALIRFDTAGTFAASNSILSDPNGADSGVVLDAPSGTTFNVNCVLVHEDSGLVGKPGVTNLIVADPQWDTSGLYPAGLYVPGPDSPAVDACGPGTGMIPDLLGGARPRDLPKPNGAGPYDMGAIERLPDNIFGDGFEQP
ncbi:MAG: hypothetical protein ABIQ70_09890 [Dokdonella sp.]